jgi:hypothetical protein
LAKPWADPLPETTLESESVIPLSFFAGHKDSGFMPDLRQHCLAKPMKRALRAIIALFLILAECLHAEIHKFDQATIERLGIAIFEQDVRAATATDLLFEKKIDPEKEGLRGWIVEGDARNMLVRFVREKDGLLEAFYDVTFGGKKTPVISEPSNRKLSDHQLAQFKARSLALKNITRPASRNYNLVILPNPENAGFLIYALASTAEVNAVMVGGHYRFMISQDGERLERSDELFKSFMVLSTKQKDLPPGSKLEALTMTTLVSDMPLETHVYLSLLHRMAFYVGTPDQHVWKVQNGKIQIVNGK